MNKWFIPDEYLDADSDLRCSQVIVDKDVLLPETVYEPLYTKTNVATITLEPLAIKCAVYELDRLESYNKPFNFYFYKGDVFRWVI